MQQSVRERLMAATLRVILEQGLAAATSKAIAREAGVAVGSIYNHFADKADLVSAVLLEGIPDLQRALFTLQSRVGRGTVKNNLERLASEAVDYFVESLPVTCAVFGNPGLMPVVHTRLVERGRDLAHLHDQLAGYLAEEQRIGRVRQDANPSTAAALLFGACNYYALLAQVNSGAAPMGASASRYATSIVRELLPALVMAEPSPAGGPL